MTRPQYATGSLYEECYAGPKRWHTSSATPDGRQRRNRGSSRENAGGALFDGFIEEDFRVGGPYLCRLPCLWFELDKNERPYKRLFENGFDVRWEITRILGSVDMTPVLVKYGQKLSRLEPEDSPLLTILVLTRRKRFDTTWLETARRLRNYIRDLGFPSINIEIADFRAFEPPRISPVITDDNDLFQEIRRKVSDVIAQSGRWDQSMSTELCRFGQSLDRTKNPITVRVQIEANAENRDYRPLRERVVALLDANGWHGVAVLILRGGIVSISHVYDREEPPAQGTSW
ncbi:hypothetical protein BJY00DRAFT_317608 [Aspergillus carlsbadensis]|nr:hypothetical protein BJY00DRAFT_317608 [Aspergillus carlsbadensis]